MGRYSEEEFLKQVLAVTSVNSVDDERKIAQFLAEYLRESGVNAVVQEIDEKHANVIAVVKGRSSDKVIWNGHLDTVPYGKLSEWDTEPDRPVKKNGCMYARGASDMKSGLAAMVYTLGRMQEKGYVPKQTIYFFGTCDEEKGGMGAKEIVKSGFMEGASLLLIGEPTGCKIGLAQKGCIWLRAKVHGMVSHGACPQEGVNAAEHGIRIYEELKQEIERHEHQRLGRATIQITGISGGVAPNMTPDEAEILMDIRTVPGITEAEILEWAGNAYQKQKAKTHGKLSMEFEIINSRRPIETEQNHPWVRSIAWELKNEQIEPEYMGIPYFTDASILTKSTGDVPVLLLGPGEPEMAHKPNEYVEIKKYMQFIRLLKRLFFQNMVE